MVVVGSILLSAWLVRVVTNGHVVNRWSAVSCVPESHVMHSVIAGQPFLCSTSAMWILFCRSSQIKILIFGGI
jgi:hypothetical protein